MKHYELFYLIPAHIPETQLEAIQSEVSDWILSLGGSITKHEQWGRKKLAYPIRNEKFGFYLLADFDMDADKLSQLQKKLELHKFIIRHLILTKKPMSARELLMQEKARKRAQSRASSTDERPPRSSGTPRETHESKKAKEKKEESKISLEDLDKKLDELLDTDIIH